MRRRTTLRVTAILVWSLAMLGLAAIMTATIAAVCFMLALFCLPASTLLSLTEGSPYRPWRRFESMTPILLGLSSVFPVGVRIWVINPQYLWINVLTMLAGGLAVLALLRCVELRGRSRHISGKPASSDLEVS